MSADPPRPFPSWLMPVRGRLGENDLRLVLATREFNAIGEALKALGLDSANMMLTHREGSPWIEVAAVPVPDRQIPLEEMSEWAIANGVVSLALWRYTCAVYRVGLDGAVEDEPFYRP